MAKWRKSLALFLAVVMVVTFTISGIVLPTSAEGEATEPTSDVVYSEDFESEDHGWTLDGVAQDVTADGEENAFLVTGKQDKALSPRLDLNLTDGEKYILRMKVKAIGEADTQDSFMLYFDAGGSGQNATYSVMAGTTYSSSRYAIPTDTYMYMQHQFYAQSDVTTLRVGAFSYSGSLSYLIDNVEVIKADNETNLAPNWNFEDADSKSIWFGDMHNRLNATIVEEADGNHVLQCDAGSSTYYIRMTGVTNKKTYEVKFRYKGKFSGSYFAGAKMQTIKSLSTSASSEWREYHAYMANNNSNVGWIGLKLGNGMLIDDIVVREITTKFDNANTDVFVGNTAELAYTVKPELSTALELTWASSDETVATVANGVITGVAEGTATITAKNKQDIAVATTTVTVKNKPVATAIQLDKAETPLLIGKTLTLTASCIPEDAEMPEIVWSSSDDTIATVTDGVVTAVAEGNATITATAEGLEPVTCAVTVEALPKATKIILDNTSLTLQEDATSTLTATWLPEEAAPTIVWTSSNEQVVTVVDGEVTAVGIGVATISASAAGVDIEPATCHVTVTAKNLIKNGDFESGTTAWAAGGVDYITDTGSLDGSGYFNFSYTHDGNGNKQFTLRYGGANLASLKPNTKYVLSFDYKAYGAGFARISSWTSGIGDTAFTKSSWTKDLAVKTEWTHYTLTFTTLDADAIAAASKAYILYLEYVMYGNASGTGTGNFAVDNISLNTAPVTAYSVELDKTAEGIDVGETVTLTPSFAPVGYPSADLIWETADESIATVADGVVTGVSTGATTITATAKDMAPVTFKVEVKSKTLLSNGDFEAGANSVWGSNTTRIQKGFGKDGSYGFQSERSESNGDWDAGNGQYYKAAFLGKLKPSTTYILSFDYKNTGKGRGQLYVNYNFGTIGENTAWDSNHAYDLPAGEIDWRTITITFTTPETITTNANWEFNPRSRGQAGFTYYDNFRLVEAATAGIGSVYADVTVDEGELTFISAGDENATETLKDVEAGTEVTVDVTAKEGYLMVPGSLKYFSTVTGQETKILNKELGFNPENFGSEEFSGDTFTFTMPEAGASVTAEFVPISEQNFAMDTVGTGLRVKGEEYNGIRFLTRMNMAFSFNEIAAQDDIVLTVTYQGAEYTVKELGSMLIRAADGLDADAMTPADAATYWKKSVAYTEGGDMTLLDYTNRYIDFTVVVTKGANVSAEDFEAREYSARGYMVLEDAEGQTKTIVCDNVMTNSVNNAKGKVA